MQERLDFVLLKLSTQSKAIRDNIDEIATIIAGIGDSPDCSLGDAARAWIELGEENQKAIWIAPSKGGILTTKERETIQTTEFREAANG